MSMIALEPGCSGVVDLARPLDPGSSTITRGLTGLVSTITRGLTGLVSMITRA
ncbi:hypothetical protein [Micromonospora sp. NPDC005710]|uniref:hypothetical protein n=1 Tax=Micromonospora sp. NPDC005710 TaxID=3157051 RepID=UPI0034024522